jgi:hypothetical protein
MAGLQHFHKWPQCVYRSQKDILYIISQNIGRNIKLLLSNVHWVKTHNTYTQIFCRCLGRLQWIRTRVGYIRMRFIAGPLLCPDLYKTSAGAPAARFKFVNGHRLGIIMFNNEWHGKEKSKDTKLNFVHVLQFQYQNHIRILIKRHLRYYLV